MRVAPLPTLLRSRESELPTRSPSAQWLGRHSSSLSTSDSDSDDSSSSSTGSYYSALARNSTARMSTTPASKRCSAKPVPTAAASDPQHGCLQRCLYRHPRIAFSLVLLLSAISTGAYSSYFLATLSLQLAGAPAAFAHVRTQLLATEITLRHTTDCTLRLLTARVAVLKAHVEMETQPFKAAFDAYTAQQRQGRANLTACTARVVAAYEALLDDDETATPERLSCLVDGIQQTLTQYEATFESLPSTSLTQLSNRFTAVMRSAITRKTHDAATPTVSEIVASKAKEGVAVLDQWLSQLGETLKLEFDDMAATVALPATRAAADQNEPLPPQQELFTTKDAVMQRLRRAVGDDHKQQRLVHDIDAAWSDTAQLARQEHDKSAQYQDDVAQIHNATLAQMQHAADAIARGITTLRDVVVRQTQASIESLATAVADSIVSTVQKNLGQLGWPLATLLTPNATTLDAFDRLSQPHAAAQWSVGKENLELHFNALDAAVGAELSLHASPTPVPEPVAYTPDTATFRASLLEVSSVVVTLVLTYDFVKRATWLLSKIAALMTESYSDLPPVDIRDIAPLTTLLDLWGVLKCRHDFGSVVLSLLTESSYVVQTAIHFVLWVLLEIGGTAAFVTWQRDYARRCRPAAGEPPSHELTLNCLWLLELLLGQLTQDGLRPLHSAQNRSKQLYDALEKDATDWQQQIHTTAETHPTRVNELLLERRFLLDLRTNLESCSLPLDASTLDSQQCSLSALSQSQDYASWEQTATIPFHSEQVGTFLQPEPLVAECLHHNSDARAAVATVARLELARSCQLDQNLYLSLASWWMLFVVGLALRFISRMVVKAAGMAFWRFLSGDRLDVMAYCDERGVVQSPERLPKAVRRHLRNIRWRVTARLTGVALAIASVIAIASIVLSSEMMEPLA